MSKITDYTLSFSLVRNYIVYTFKRYYGEYIVLGRENIPVDCPVIFAPNHINAFMDAIAVHSIAPHKIPVIFLARADVFNNKTAVKVLKFAKILPAFRMRDGMENLGKNNEVFEQCVEILHQNKALGIMPEGNQGEQRKLRPLVKGIFRIAFAAQQKYNIQPKVKIVPVGIDYGDLTKYGKHIIINIGKPIEVSEYMQKYADNPVTATNEIRERLATDLNKLSLNLATEKHYECFETITEIANTTFVKNLHLPDTTISRFAARQVLAKRLIAIEKADPDKMENLDALSKEYAGVIKMLNLRSSVLEQNNTKIPNLVIAGLIQLITLPIFVYGLLCNFLPFFIPVCIRKYVLKAKYEGFYSSLQFVLGIITFPLCYVLQSFLFCGLISHSWWMILLFFFLQYPSGKYAIKWNSRTKKFFATIRFRKLTQKKSFELLQAQRMREQIIRMIS
ncbi:MAG: 1-acyl-sn-glycerol-3-phosphate acyltransferase [Paludibacter sp.]|nr:1-acyl-sn-glycerol-3-phosphate acyltransferase [Paludibacter sp.]